MHWAFKSQLIYLSRISVCVYGNILPERAQGHTHEDNVQNYNQSQATLLLHLSSKTELTVNKQ